VVISEVSDFCHTTEVSLANGASGLSSGGTFGLFGFAKATCRSRLVSFASGEGGRVDVFSAGAEEGVLIDISNKYYFLIARSYTHAKAEYPSTP
jgi:hypothetical protein